MLPLSARTEQALDALLERYRDFLRNDPPSWSDVCYTAAQRRDHHDCRLVVLADSPQQAVDLLKMKSSRELTAPGEPSEARLFRGRKPYGRPLKLAFLFDDNAESWKSHILQLPSVSGFNAAAEDVDAALQRVAGWPLADVLNSNFPWADPNKARPGLLALQLALSAWWRTVGVSPDVVLGHGIGELAAACAAGILTLDECLLLAVGRGEGVHSRPALLPFLSAVDGKPHPGPDLDSSHWQLCLEHSAGHATAVAALQGRNVDVCVKIELGPTIVTPRPMIAAQSSLHANAEGSDLHAMLLAAVGALYAAGADFVWQRLARN